MTLTIEVRVKPGKANELYQTLQALLSTIRKAKGCLCCFANQGVSDVNVQVLSCDWESRANFEEYIRSASGSALIGALDLLCESVRIRGGDGSASEGIETLKEMRRDMIHGRLDVDEDKRR